MVIARNPAAFAFRYGAGIAAPAGFGEGSSPALSNSGETVALTAANGDVIVEFTYSDSAPWPVDADGAGYSLTAQRPGVSDPNDPETWRTSAASGGTPGTGDTVKLSAWLSGFGVANAESDTDGDGLPALVEYAAGLAPNAPGGSAPAAFEWVDADGTVYPAISFVQKIGTDDAVLSAEVSSDLAAWLTAETGDVVFLGRQNNGDGTETVRHRAAEAAGAARRFLRYRVFSP